MANRTIIYINDQAVDLAPNTVVAGTFQAFEIGDLRSRNANYTNQFKLPKTGNNKKVLEFVNNEFSTSTTPYRKLPAKVVQNGIETIPVGVAVVVNTNEFFNISIYSGTFSFFDLITGLNIDQIDFGTPIVTWDNTQLSLSRGSSGEVEADHKNLTSAFYNTGVKDWSAEAFFAVTDDTSYPSVRYAAIIKNIITNAGYTYSGNVFTNDKFLKLVIPYSKQGLQFSGTFITNREFKATKTISQVVTNPGAGYDHVTFPNVEKADGYGMYNGSDTYDTSIASSGFGDDRSFNFGLYAEVTFTVTSGTYRFKIFTDNIDFPTVVSSDYTAGTYTVRIGYDEAERDQSLIARDGKYYFIGCQRVVAGSVTITSGKFYNKVYGQNYSPTSPKFFQNEVLPSIPQKDIFKDFAIRFGLLFKEANKVIYAKSIDEIIADKSNAVDWTTKRVIKNTEDITYNLNGYSQKNYLKYPTNDELYDPVPDNGSIDVNNVNIDLSNDFYESIFNGSATSEVSTTTDALSCLKVPLFSAPPATPDYQTSFDNDPGYRVALMKQMPANGFNVFFGGSPYTDFSVLYFSDPGSANQMSWQQSVDDNYSQLVSSLDQAKVLTRYYRLNELDIQSIDMFKLVYDNGGYYIINSIQNFIPGIPTKVELFKVV
jgi:hypothetical protein